MFSYRSDFSRRFQKSTPKMANLAFVRNADLQCLFKIVFLVQAHTFLSALTCNLQ
jgi:hypothetical protein